MATKPPTSPSFIDDAPILSNHFFVDFTLLNGDLMDTG